MIKIYIYILFLILLMPALLNAEIVHYIDENGKRHYVNTDYSRVPPQYLYQVQDQLNKEPEIEDEPEAVENQEDKSDAKDDKVAAPKKRASVILLITAECPPCKRLDTQMRGNGIKFYRYDIERNAKGIRLYRKHGGELPIVLINDVVLSVPSIRDVLSTIKEEENPDDAE